VVRGAYIVPETSAAAAGGYENPVHDSYEETNASYDAVAELLLSHVTSKTYRLI